MERENRKKLGKKSRRLGKDFENKVRKDLESKGYIVCKWTNNIEDNKIIQTKMKFNPFTKRIMMASGGFPDFIAFFPILNSVNHKTYVIAVESKMNGILDKIEKEKCEWYIKNNIFSKIYVAKNGGTGIIYKQFQRKNGPRP